MSSITNLSVIFNYNEVVYAKKNIVHKLVNKLKKLNK